MHVLQSFQSLVDDVNFVNFFKNTSSNYSMEIALHVLEDQVEVLIVFCFDNVKKFYNVLMAVEFLE